jgi:hypothetical protein
MRRAGLVQPARHELPLDHDLESVAKARTQALALIGKLRDALDADLIVDAVVVQPKPPARKRM